MSSRNHQKQNPQAPLTSQALTDFRDQIIMPTQSTATQGSEKTSVQLHSRDSPESHDSSHDSSHRISAARIDHGWLAWSQVLVSHFLVINGFGYVSAFGLFQSHWESALERSPSDIAWVGSIQLFLLFFVGTLSGRAMDAGFFRSLLYFGCFMQLLGVFTTSAVDQYWQLVLAQGITQGIGNGVLFTPCVALVSTYFQKRRAFALGVAACGAPVGGVTFSLVCHSLPCSFLHAYAYRVARSHVS